MDYGVKPTGFVRKPLSSILADIEAAMITEFGPGVIQTSQSPLGQLNGLIADMIAEMWELAEDVYQSYDPDQAEGTRLETLGRLRLIYRGADDDMAMRQSITNAGLSRVDIQDISRAVAGIDGVTYSRVWVNDTSQTDGNGVPRNSVAIAVIGGDDDEIGSIIRRYVLPGIGTYGNYTLDTVIDGYCRSYRVVRPIEVPMDVTVNVSLRNDRNGCPPPSLTAIRNALFEMWDATRENGKDVTEYTVRSLIEGRFNNVEVVSVNATRPGEQTDINFLEIAYMNEVIINVVS